MVEKKILQPGPEGKILANYNLTIIISYSLLSMPNDLPIKRVILPIRLHQNLQIKVVLMLILDCILIAEVSHLKLHIQKLGYFTEYERLNKCLPPSCFNKLLRCELVVTTYWTVGIS